MNRLRELRRDRGLTQEQLAEQTGVSVRAIKYHEANERKPSYKTLKALASTLNVPMDELF